jgi:hypothetical protein
MNIYDNGYLTDEEKNLLDIQDLIYLAISNYTNQPVPEILPNYIFRYKLESDNKVSIMSLRLPQVRDSVTEVLWDDFVNHSRKNKNLYPGWQSNKEVYIFDKYFDGSSFVDFPVKLEEEIELGEIQSSAKPKYRFKVPDVIYSTSLIPEQYILECMKEAKHRAEVPF